MSASTKAVLSQALEAMERASKTTYSDTLRVKFDAALAEGEAEPVAYRWRFKDSGEWQVCHLPPRPPEGLMDVEPLYTHPSPAALRAAVIEAIEECAQIAESSAYACDAGEAIRALKEKA